MAELLQNDDEKIETMTDEEEASDKPEQKPEIEICEIKDHILMIHVNLKDKDPVDMFKYAMYAQHCISEYLQKKKMDMMQNMEIARRLKIVK